MNTFYKATGIFGVALLALTACADTSEDAGQEGMDPDGAEDQGDTPGEIAGEDTDGGDEGDADTDEEPDDETTDVPALSEINDQIWEASADQDSVTISIELTGSPAEELVEEQNEEDSEDEDGENETVQITITGDVDGDGVSYIQQDAGEYLIFDDGDVYFQTIDTFVDDYETAAQAQGAPMEISPEDLREALSAEGNWIEVTSSHADFVESPADFFVNFQAGFVEGSLGTELGDLETTGEVDTRGGENVWVYAEGSFELVVLADHDEPLLMEINMEEGEENIHVSLTDWNETDEPERPEDEEIIFEDELDPIVEPLVQ